MLVALETTNTTKLTCENHFNYNYNLGCENLTTTMTCIVLSVKYGLETGRFDIEISAKVKIAVYGNWKNILKQQELLCFKVLCFEHMKMVTVLQKMVTW